MRVRWAPLWLLAACAPVVQAAEPAGTFSIVAYDSLTNEVGVAVQSRVFGVGPRVAWVRGGVGAIATQAQSNESFGPTGLYLMDAGLSAEEALDWLLGHDEGRDSRQVGVVDARGGVATWTGRGCMDWAGDSSGTTFACQGNILAGRAVVAEMVRAFTAAAGEELAERLIAALEAGQAAGGDSRGQQSAAILIGRPHRDYPEYTFRYVDIRVEDHASPIAELRRLYEIYEAQGLLQAHMRFAEWMEASGDTAGAHAERDRVARTLTRVLARESADAGTLNSLAWFCATHDLHLEESLVAALRAVELQPEDANILDTLAEVYFRLGRVGEAIETEERALGLSPGDAYLQEQLQRFRSGSR
ncbi:MAG: DUF1028 domain-containing protein [Candidatus Eisenbacteria bacterium]|uniref:DUF1028 domain-containing protein n=1 Tax=Eiseniibacteriota bacterium TaxID=2212470 RepID=A0A937XAW6_UNCEI|nr:DUF1028 domain-containing protein [Candidatus Eisenbacteria bacterium]